MEYINVLSVCVCVCDNKQLNYRSVSITIHNTQYNKYYNSITSTH